MRLALVVVALGMAGCGGSGGGGGGGTADGASLVCSAAGAGTVSGSVNGVSVGAVTGASGLSNTPFSAFEVVLDDHGNACQGTTTGDNDLALLICELPPTARTYGITTATDCTSGMALAQLQKDNGSAAGSATGGSVVVTSATGDCVTGTFTLEFGSETLTGDFAAVSCDLTGSNQPH